jgi:hypothetical protein
MVASAADVNRCPRLIVAHRWQSRSDGSHGAGEPDTTVLQEGPVPRK